MASLHKVEIRDKRRLSEDTWVLEFDQPEIAAAARPGNFVMVSPMRESVNYDPITPRPYSIFGLLFDDNGDPRGFSLIIKVFGRGSEAICSRGVGETLTINGPLGNQLDLEGDSHFCMVAGGTGIAPAAFTSQLLQRQGRAHTILYGGQTASAVFLDELKRFGINATPATDDGSLGHHGLVTDLLHKTLDTHPEAHVFSCGPWGMMRASASIATERGVNCTCSLERYMACGFGVCLACIYSKTTDDLNHTSCKEGPVVNGLEVDWDA